jgi:prepilin-type processing-associated H-X9-DG protein
VSNAIKSIEQLRYNSAGELGNLLGLDRIPEVRTLRNKVQHLSEKGEVEQWSRTLSKDWMAGEPESAGVLYVDGHVRVYHGSQTPLPRRYVSRQRLCLRGMMDTWVNNREGLPYFVVSTPFSAHLGH